MSDSYPLIEQEQIPKITFVNKEVLQNPTMVRERAEKLLNAVLRCKLLFQKTKIVFNTSSGFLRVNANIYEATEHYVVLQGGISIPVTCIKEVD